MLQRAWPLSLIARERAWRADLALVSGLPARFSGIFFQKFTAVEIRPRLHADSGVERKSCEDTGDAVVCAWGAMCALAACFYSAVRWSQEARRTHADARWHNSPLSCRGEVPLV